jgi:hypothetical protein
MGSKVDVTVVIKAVEGKAMTAIELLSTEPAAWEVKIAELSPAEREHLTNSLSAVLERAALARGYMDGAYLFGTGTHARGVKAAYALRVKICKALGYACPKS